MASALKTGVLKSGALSQPQLTAHRTIFSQVFELFGETKNSAQKKKKPTEITTEDQNTIDTYPCVKHTVIPSHTLPCVKEAQASIKCQQDDAPPSWNTFSRKKETPYAWNPFELEHFSLRFSRKDRFGENRDACPLALTYFDEGKQADNHKLQQSPQVSRVLPSQSCPSLFNPPKKEFASNITNFQDCKKIMDEPRRVSSVPLLQTLATASVADTIGSFHTMNGAHFQTLGNIPVQSPTDSPLQTLINSPLQPLENIAQQPLNIPQQQQSNIPQQPLPNIPLPQFPNIPPPPFPNMTQQPLPNIPPPPFSDMAQQPMPNIPHPPFPDMVQQPLPNIPPPPFPDMAQQPWTNPQPSFVNIPQQIMENIPSQTLANSPLQTLAATSAVCNQGCPCPFPCGPCGNKAGACCLPPPCNTPPKCVQYMTGYYYYPYGIWFCGPYHVTGLCCPGGPLSCAGGPCAPSCACPGGPCGPTSPGSVC